MNTEQIINAEPEPTMNETFVESYREVKNILVSQPKPADKSPYYELEKKYNLTIDWRSFIHVEPFLQGILESSEFELKISPLLF